MQEEIAASPSSGDLLRDALYAISRAAHRASDLNALYPAIHGIVGTLMHAPNFYIALHDPALDLIQMPFYSDEYDTEFKGSASTRKAGQGLTEYIIRTGEALLASADELADMAARGLIVRRGGKARSWMGVPLKSGSSIFGMIAVQSYTDEILYSRHELELLVFVSDQIAMAIERKKTEAAIQALNERLTDENRRLESELEVVQRLQAMVLPKASEIENLEGLDLAGYMKPADEVGGDYYDIFPTEGAINIGIGDVTGHGLESGVLMIMAQTAVRTLLLGGIKDPSLFLVILNRVLYENAKRMGVDRSMTLSFLSYDKGSLDLSGQHEPMVIVRKGGEIELVETVELGFPLGLIAETKDFFRTTTVPLESGDGVVLYSDGITEAIDVEDREYGIDRLCDAARRNWGKPARQVLDEIVKDLEGFRGPARILDDCTLVVLRRL